MDLLAVESVVGALGYGLFGHLFAGERDQGLAAALSAEVVQNENSIRLELRGRQKQAVSDCGTGWSSAAQTPGELEEEGRSPAPVRLKFIEFRSRCTSKQAVHACH